MVSVWGQGTQPWEDWTMRSCSINLGLLFISQQQLIDLEINQFLSMPSKKCLQSSFSLPYFHCLTQRSQAQNVSGNGGIVTTWRLSIRTNLSQGVCTWCFLFLEHSSHLLFTWLLTTYLSCASLWKAFSECPEWPILAMFSFLKLSKYGMILLISWFILLLCFIFVALIFSWSVFHSNNFCLI